MSDAHAQTLKNEIAAIEQRMEVHRGEVTPIAARAVGNGLLALLALAALIGAAGVAASGYVLPGVEAAPVVRMLAGGLAVVLLSCCIVLWRNQLAYPAEIMGKPGWSRDEMRRLKELKRRLRDAEAGQ